MDRAPLKKAHKSPIGVLTSFFQSSIIKISSSIETFYWFEDILSEQILVIIEKIHHLNDWGLVIGLDLNKAKYIQGKLPDQCEIVPRSLCWGSVFSESIIQDMVQAVFHTPVIPLAPAHFHSTHLLI